MNACLRVGNLEFTGEQLVVALARYQMLENFVSQVILDAVLNEAVKLTELDIRQALGIGDDGDFGQRVGEWIKKNQVSFEYLQQVVLRQLRLDKLKRERFDSQVGSEFLRRKPEFDQVEFSLIRTHDSILAQELYFQIRDDAVDFGRLARKYSEGAEKYTKGWMGPMRLSELPLPVQDLLRKQSIASVQGPVLVGNSYWILRLERFFPARMTMQVRHELREQLFETWLKARTKAFMSDPNKVEVIKASIHPHALQANNQECA
ncbi:peptidylprolyl isomerase [Leptolyngbya sp. AN03gr2]|uniref:peptidylprolyl isomerase n=1 Tax=unclassified Leptolyngbya TaxID=2650499 RepID=UPI003D3176D5